MTSRHINSKPSRLTLIMANIVAPIGLLAVFAATAAPFFMADVPWARQAYPFVYAAGAFILLVARLLCIYPTDDIKLRRLYRLDKWSPVIFMVGAALLFYNPSTLRDWLAFTMAGAALQVYTGFAIPARQAKLARSSSSSDSK